MFKPRNARNALNRTAGIPSVARFQTGGSVGAVTPFMGRGPTIQLNPAGPRSRRGTSLGGRSFIAPNRATTPGRAAELELARRALEGGMGALSAGEQAMLGMSSGARTGGAFTQPLTDYLGDSALSSFVKGAGEIGGTIAGGIGGGITGLLSGEPSEPRPPTTVNIPPKGKNETQTQYEARVSKAMAQAREAATPDTLAGRLSGAVPDIDYLRSLGFEFPTQVYNQQPGPPPPPAAPSAASRPTSLGPGRFRQLALPGSSSAGIPDGERAAREREMERARAITAAGGTVDVDEVTGEIRPGPPEEIQQLIDAAEKQKRTLESEDRRQQGQLGTETETETETTTDTGTTTTTAEPGTTAETSAEVYDDAILREARKANDASGLPKLETATDELDAAMQAGTQSPEDIKAEFLKLLPKYEEDPSVAGLNLALMGFMVASEKGGDALENISNGIKKGLPAFIKSKEKKKAFEREVDLLASKYTVGRLEEDRKTSRQKNTYFATEAFTLPNGEKVEEGQIFRLNDGAFQLAEKQGLTRFLTSEANYGTQITAAAAVEKAKLSQKGTSLDDMYEKSTDVEIGGQKIRVRFPSASGEAAGFVARPSGGEAAWKAFTTGYAENLDQIRFADKGVGSAIALLDNDKALGASGLIGKIVDATKAVVPEKYGSALGIDYDTLSDANQFEVLQRSLALQLAPVLLQESGKTISDADRARVAAALGFKVDQNNNIVFDNGIVNAFKTEEEARRSLQEVQRVLRRNATKLHAEYGKAAKLFGMQGLPTETAGAAGFVVQEGGEDDEFDLAIVAG